MKLTQKQAHVLANVDRVKPLARRLVVRSPTAKYQLDGWNCTAQITGLRVRRRIKAAPNGGFVCVASAR